jgi:hypothetical protein
MSSLAVGGIVFACVLGGAILGWFLRTRLPADHLTGESKDVVRLAMGLVGTLTALVLGLLVASAKGSFDTQRNGVSQIAAGVVVLDRTLANYGKETQEVRELLRASVADMIDRTWPEEAGGASGSGTRTEGKYEALYEKTQGLAPKTDAQRALQSQALKAVTDLGQLRWALSAQQGSSIPVPFLVIMVSWLVLILGSFGLFAPGNRTTVTALVVCSWALASAVFLVLELDRPFQGMIHISSEPLRNALAQLGH